MPFLGIYWPHPWPLFWIHHHRLVLLIGEFHMNRIIQYILFYTSFTHHICEFRPCCMLQLFVLLYSLVVLPTYIYIYMYHNLFVCSPIDGNLSCFQVFAVMIMVLWTFLNMSYGGHRPLYLLDKYLGVESLHHKAHVCFTLVNTAK